eukprot:611844-Pleurochrysis_carterae.AAC.1
MFCYDDGCYDSFDIPVVESKGQKLVLVESQKGEDVAAERMQTVLLSNMNTRLRLPCGFLLGRISAHTVDLWEGFRKVLLPPA